MKSCCASCIFGAVGYGTTITFQPVLDLDEKTLAMTNSAFCSQLLYLAISWPPGPSACGGLWLCGRRTLVEKNLDGNCNFFLIETQLQGNTARASHTEIAQLRFQTHSWTASLTRKASFGKRSGLRMFSCPFPRVAPPLSLMAISWWGCCW